MAIYRNRVVEVGVVEYQRLLDRVVSQNGVISGLRDTIAVHREEAERLRLRVAVLEAEKTPVDLAELVHLRNENQDLRSQLTQLSVDLDRMNGLRSVVPLDVPSRVQLLVDHLSELRGEVGDLKDLLDDRYG